jgi:hypothetical protein
MKNQVDASSSLYNGIGACVEFSILIKTDEA